MAVFFFLIDAGIEMFKFQSRRSPGKKRGLWLAYAASQRIDLTAMYRQCY